MRDKEEIVIVTMRCIDTAAFCSNIDKIKCSECGEMTWLSVSWREKKIDKAICEQCFEGERQKKSDYTACVTKRCLNDALKQLKETCSMEGTDEDIKRRMVAHIEKKMGVKITITD